MVGVPNEFVRLKHKHVHERRLSMMQMPYNGDVADHVRKRGHVQQETAKYFSELTNRTHPFMAYPLSKRVSGISFSSTFHFRTFIGATMGCVRGWASSSCTIVSTSGP